MKRNPMSPLTEAEVAEIRELLDERPDGSRYGVAIETARRLQAEVDRLKTENIALRQEIREWRAEFIVAESRP